MDRKLGVTVDLFNTERIKIVLAVAERKSFSKAAAKLGVSQPFISQQIRKIEEEVGKRLLERHTRSVSLTKDGEAFVVFARTMLAVGDAARRHFMQPPAAGSLRLGIRETVRKSLLLGFLGEFYAHYPYFTLEVRCDVDGRLLSGLEAAHHDIIIVGQLPGTPRGEFLRSFEVAWFGKEKGSPVMDPIPLVMPPASDGIRDLALQALSDHGRTWRISVESSSSAVLEAAITAGLGISPMTTKVNHDDCVVLDDTSGLPQLPPFNVAMLHNKTETGAGTDAVEAFCDIIRSLYTQDRMDGRHV